VASPKIFAKRIRARAKRVETNSNALKIKTSGAILQTVVLATPVDTGRARGNWQVGLGTPISSVKNAADKSGSGAISQGISRAASAKSKQNIYISNNVPYINRLNDGYSAQAPAGFVEQAVAVGERAARNGKVL